MNRANIVCESIWKKSKATLGTANRTPEVDNEAALLDPDVNKSLKQHWLSPTGTGFILVKNVPRTSSAACCGETEFVKRVYTMAPKETPVLSGVSRKGRQALNQYIDLVYTSKEMNDALGDDETFHVDGSPWQFLIALENLLRSLCLAGSFFVQDPSLKAAWFP